MLFGMKPMPLRIAVSVIGLLALMYSSLVLAMGFWSKPAYLSTTEAGIETGECLNCSSRVQPLDVLTGTVKQFLTKSSYAPICENGGTRSSSSEERDNTIFIRALFMRDNGNTCRQLCPAGEYCGQVEKCYRQCRRSQLAYLCKGGEFKVREAKEDRCVDVMSCSSFSGMNNDDRARYIYESLRDVVEGEDFKKAWPELSGVNIAAHFTCINLEKENPSLEPMNVNNGYCTSTAIGIGQVVNTSFLVTFESTRAELDRNPKLTLGEMCRRGGAFMRSEIWCSSHPSEMTLGELFENSAFDPAIQIESMLGVYLNHYLWAGRDWEKGWRGYYGVGKAGGYYTRSHKNKITDCVRRLMHKIGTS